MAEEILYDAEAQQSVPLKLEKRGKLYKVAHQFAPLIDDDILDYERQRDLRITEAEFNETDDPDALAISSNSFKAAVKLWDHLILSIEGYKLPGDQDWKTLINATDKAFAIESGLLAVGILPLPEADAADAYPLDDEDASSTIQLRCLFNGQQVITKHVLREATPGELAKYQGLMSRTLLVQGTRTGKSDRRVPSRAKGLAELYDSLKVEASGYKGRVPLHHKTAVVLHHLGQQQEVIAGN